MKERNPRQMSFLIEGDQFVISENLSNHPLGPQIIETLSASSLFQDRPRKGNALLIDCVNEGEKPKMAIYNPNTWQQTPEKPELLINPPYSLIIFVLPSLVETEDLVRLINQNKKNLNRNGGEIFVLEMLFQPLGKDEQKNILQQRKNALQLEGWVKIAVKTHQIAIQQDSPSFLLTQARLKKVVKHHEVDLSKKNGDELYFLGETSLSVSCGDCGDKIIQTVILIKKGKKNSKIGIEIKCPHCGLISYQEKSVPNKSLIRRSRL